VYAWWPLEGAFRDQPRKIITEQNVDGPTKVVVPAGGTVIPCYTQEINMDPVKLPILPDLPELPATGLPEEESREETKLVEIEALPSCLVGLTNKGHVLKMYMLEGSTRSWKYVSESAWVVWHPFLNLIHSCQNTPR
jgi:SCF-associated factor 1